MSTVWWLLAFGRRSKQLITVSLLMPMAVAIGALLLASLVIAPYHSYVLEPSVDQTATTVGLVLGAGITNDGVPYQELQARLDLAAAAFAEGRVQKLLLSGDNRFKNYNEPQAMADYLVSRHGIPADSLQPDYAGRSTYESCERAYKIFGLERTIIFSARSHLPRAIFLCRSFGVEAFGIASDVEANNSFRREPLAKVKAVFNVYVRGEDTVLGRPIPIGP